MHKRRAFAAPFRVILMRRILPLLLILALAVLSPPAGDRLAGQGGGAALWQIGDGVALLSQPRAQRAGLPRDHDGDAPVILPGRAAITPANTPGRRMAMRPGRGPSPMTARFAHPPAQAPPAFTV